MTLQFTWKKPRIFLNTGKIPLSNLGWTPPLYEIVLAMFISLTGATDIGQLIFLVKVLAVIDRLATVSLGVFDC